MLSKIKRNILFLRLAKPSIGLNLVNLLVVLLMPSLAWMSSGKLIPSVLTSILAYPLLTTILSYFKICFNKNMAFKISSSPQWPNGAEELLTLLAELVNLSTQPPFWFNSAHSTNSVLIKVCSISWRRVHVRVR